MHVACSLYKLAHAFKYSSCSELFNIKKSTIHLVMHEFVCTMNSIFKNQMKWPKGNDLIEAMDGFKDLLWHAISPWRHKCNANSCAEDEGPSLCN